MSQPYKAAQIIRCPFCTIATTPTHIGHAVMICENCGNTFRVVHAQKGKTGRKLAKFVRDKVAWKGDSK